MLFQNSTFADSRGACSNKNSRSNFEPWWGKSNYTLIEESAQCLMEDFPPGVIAAEYFPHPNFSQPDNVKYLVTTGPRLISIMENSI